MSKPKAPIRFVIKRSPKTKQFRCVIEGGNFEVTYTGEPCKNKNDVWETINSHVAAIQENRFSIQVETPKIKLKKPKHYEGHLNRNWP